MIDFFYSEQFVVFGLIPALIFFARIIDVSLGTLRIILLSRGVKLLASVLGFFEVLVWIVAITNILGQLNNFVGYIAWASGFACGTYVGMMLEEKLSIGRVRVRIITKKNLKSMIDSISHTQHVFISDHVESSSGKIKIINAFLDRKHVSEVLKAIREVDEKAFYTVEDMRLITDVNGMFPSKRSFSLRRFIGKAK